MVPSVVDTVAKFFYFSCLDEALSFTASLRVLSDLRANNHIDENHRSQWIRTLTKWRGRLGALNSKSWNVEGDSRGGFELPPDFDMGAWMTFLSSSDPREVEAVLLSRILSFTDEEIAKGLNVSVGTVRYRVGRGLRHLGGFIEF